MGRFETFIPFILKWETEYDKSGNVLTEHDKDDPGGTTKYGIDQRAHPKVDIESLTKEQAIAIYLEEWKEESIEGWSFPLGEVYFNACVNCGEGRADKLLKLANGSASRFLDEQEAFYRRLNKPKYLKGWLNRTRDLRKFCNI